ncbi:hypothetical protein IFR05_016378, partial [Cadophora sp. M221]
TMSPRGVPAELLPVGQDLAALYIQLDRTDEALVVLEKMDEALVVLEKMWQTMSLRGVPVELLPVG